MSIETLYNLHRASLFSLAYRMLGSVMDAEDAVQEAFIRYSQLPDMASILNEKAFLHRMVTNRCLDLLRSSAKKRELYVGPWLPEPLIERGGVQEDPSEVYEQRESLSTAYLLLLQQLNAVERAVFLLREIFHYSFEEIAEMVEKKSANCRQIYRRAQKSLTHDPHELPSVTVAEESIRAFVQSLMKGHTERLLELVSENVVFLSDGGGKVKAAQVPVRGWEQVVKLHQHLLATYAGHYTLDYVTVNGSPGLRIDLADGGQFVYSFAYRNGQIDRIYAVANPEKLQHLKQAK
ncbi:RNA polymerase sigma factor SigJ [Paenibacillus aurantius]|uniref:RNA polymerase sigma factor SigJ n=1 Tax=Paenibacillus aurantius TaxID=2918900 RepID=A0AA96L8X0_9BACL|nr:RNA polymerase sigma factor SigJ [Paenibacillus aurantius]WNQ09201.1 RNA polymerase sigma factor SigJ [Paenibacillus aurantius]